MQVRVHAQRTSRAPSPRLTKLSLPAPNDSGWWELTYVYFDRKILKSSVMGNSAPAKRWAFAVRKKKEKSCYVMLFSLDCWWIATSYVWVRIELVPLELHDSGGEWTNPAEGGRGCLIFFVSFSGKLISFHFLFWAKKSATGPFMEMRRMPHGHEISFRDMGRMEGEEGGRMYSLEYKTTILLGDDFFPLFFRAN